MTDDAELLAQLRLAVEEYGGDIPVRALIRNTEPLDDGYTGDKPSPVYRHLPAATLYIHKGEIVAVRVGPKEKGQDDVQLKSLKRSYAKRAKIIRETGTYRGAGTQELVDNPNEAIETDHEQ